MSSLSVPELPPGAEGPPAAVGAPPDQLPSVEETLQWLQRLEATARDFAAKEEQLEHGFREAMTRQATQGQQALEEVERRLAEGQAAAETAFEEGEQRIVATLQRRIERINAAGRNLKQRYHEEIERQEGQQIYDLQRRQIPTERNREEGLKTTAAAFESFNAELATAAEALEAAVTNARRALRGWGRFLRGLERPSHASGAELALDEYKSLERLRELTTQAEAQVAQVRRDPLALLFRFLPLWLWLALGMLAGLAWFFAGPQWRLPPWPPAQVGIVLGAGFGAVWLLHFFGARRIRPAALKLVRALAEARRLQALCAEKSAARRESEIQRLTGEHAEQMAWLQTQWNQTRHNARTAVEDFNRAAEEKTVRASWRNQEVCRARHTRLEAQKTQTLERLQDDAQARRATLEKADAEFRARLEADHAARWEKLEADWRAQTGSLRATLATWQAGARAWFPDWSHEGAAAWTPPAAFAQAAQFGRLEVHTHQRAGGLPRDPRLALAGLDRLELPLLLKFPQQGSILFDSKDSGHAPVVATLNNLVLRLLSVAPPGRVNFTIIDPVALGQNFAGLMHLTDFAERLVNSRIWTQTAQIEERLAHLNEHVEKVTQMYLRNEFETIAEYNAQAGRIAEKFYFVVIADFPVNFSETAVKRLLSLVSSGPRCGVYTLLHWDQRRPVPPEFVADEMRQHSVVLRAQDEEFRLGEPPPAGARLLLDAPPDDATTTAFLQRVGRRSIDADRVEMPFDEVAPAEAELWTNETTRELRVPIGRTGAVKQQYLALGKGTRQHALIAGKTVSGR